MKRFFYYAICFASLLISFSYSQQKEIPSLFEINIPKNPVERINNDIPLSAEEQSLQNKINEIKISNDPSRKNELEHLQKTFNNRNGLIEMQAEPYDGKIIYQSGENTSKTLNEIAQIYPGNLRSFATATEQSGSNRGIAWVALTHNATQGAGPDTLDLYWTDDGINYHIFVQAVLGGTDLFAPGNIDMEIIEKIGEDKYIWVLYTYLEGGGAIRKIGGFKQPIAQEWGTMFSLSWPGQTINERYYNVSITSDNSIDEFSTYLYIACSVDSVGTAGNWFYGQKFAYVTETTEPGFPTVVYRANFLPVTWQSGDQNIRFLYTGIAYYYNQTIGSPRLMFTYSNIPDSTKIWLSECSITGISASFLGTLGSTFRIANSAIAAPGGTGNSQLMITATQNWDNSGDWDLIAFKTNNSGTYWESVAIEGSISTTDLLPSWPDIFCKRGDVNNYRISYNLGHLDNIIVPDSVMYVESINNNQNTWEAPTKVNLDIATSIDWFSRVSFIGNSGDDCFTLWKWNSATFAGLYSTSCFIPSDVNDNQFLPDAYLLSNNYPNPFNPATKIQYAIGIRQFVTLKVYDMLGREVASLINEEKQAGEYEIEFDASEFSSGVYYYRLETDNYVETKKMMLLK
jgi:hypothetical protein